MTGPRPASMDWEVVGRYLAGESSPDEAAAVRRWLTENPADARLLAALDDAAKSAAARPEVDVEAALRRVKLRMRASSPSPWRYVIGLAAAAAIVGVAVLVQRRPSEPRQRVASAERVYSTPVGARDSVVLSDGSRVLLGPASRITVLAEGREVILTGEAFFTVVHDARRPFTVHARDIVIRDVGTRFSVHNDSAEALRVVVSEGAVQLEHAGNGDTLMLRQGDVGTASSAGLQALRGAATADDLAWTQGRLVFRNATVPQVAADLRRWFGVELRMTDTALLHRHFTGTFAGESAGRVLDVVALALGARVERRGDTAYLRSTAGR